MGQPRSYGHCERINKDNLGTKEKQDKDKHCGGGFHRAGGTNWGEGEQIKQCFLNTPTVGTGH